VPLFPSIDNKWLSGNRSNNRSHKDTYKEVFYFILFKMDRRDRERIDRHCEEVASKTDMTKLFPKLLENKVYNRDDINILRWTVSCTISLYVLKKILLYHYLHKINRKFAILAIINISHLFCDIFSFIFLSLYLAIFLLKFVFFY